MENKSKSIFRVGALKFSSIFIIFSALYIIFFFDFHVEKVIKLSLEKINGAQVDVSGLKTKFLDPSIHIANIAITNRKIPNQNILEIKKAKISLEMKALLQSKIAINNISVDDILIDSNRTSPGVVFQKNEKSENNQIKLFAEKEVAKLGDKNKENAIGLLSSILNGQSLSETKDEIRARLKTENEIKSIKTELKNKKEKWSQKKQKLLKKISDYNNFKLDKNIKKAVDQLKTLKADYQFTKKEIQLFKKDIYSYDEKVKNLKQLIKNDSSILKHQVQLPKLEIEKELNSILLAYIKQEFQGPFQNLARLKEKIPHEVTATIEKKIRDKKANKDSSEIEKATKRHNKIFTFPKVGGYPYFWLKKTNINVAKEGHFSLNLLLKNISSSPSTINLSPEAFIDLIGNDISLRKLKLDATIKNDSKLYANGLIIAAPRKKLSLVKSKDFDWSLESPEDQTAFDGVLDFNSVNFKVKRSFTNYNSTVTARSNQLESILLPAFKSIKQVELEMNINGPYDSPSLSLKSETPSKISKILEKQIKNKLKNTLSSNKAKAKEKFHKQISEIEMTYQQERKKLLDKLNIKSINFKKLKKDLVEKNIKNNLKKFDLKKNLKKLF